MYLADIFRRGYKANSFAGIVVNCLTGNASELVDICFFLDSFGEKRRVDVIKELLKLAVGYEDVGFEPVALPSTELVNGNPFAMEVINTGIEI
jgi:hypothetical protein